MDGPAHGSTVELTVDALAHDRHPLDVARGSLLAFLLECSGERHDRAEALARLRGARRLKAFAESLEHAALLDVAGPVEEVVLHEVNGAIIPVRDESVAEIALVTAQSEAAIRRKLVTARTLEESLPATRQALNDGTIDPAKAALMAHAAARVPAASRASLEQQLLEPAQTLHARDFRIAAEQAIRSVDPDGTEARKARATRRRAVWVRPDEDGNSIMSARLASTDAHLCLRAIEDAVRSRRDQVNAVHDAAGIERPTLGMLHAEELASRVCGQPLTHGPSPVARQTPVHVEVQVQVDLATLAGLQDHPILIDGATPGDFDDLRHWLASADDVHFRRLIIDRDTHQVLDCGSSTYTPSRALRRFIVVRDGRCTWRGCLNRAQDCDVDHALPWHAGGRTDRDNLNSLCRPHHILKTLHGYQLARGPNDEWLVVTPTGEAFPLINDIRGG